MTQIHEERNRALALARDLLRNTETGRLLTDAGLDRKALDGLLLEFAPKEPDAELVLFERTEEEPERVREELRRGTYHDLKTGGFLVLKTESGVELKALLGLAKSAVKVIIGKYTLDPKAAMNAFMGLWGQLRLMAQVRQRGFEVGHVEGTILRALKRVPESGDTAAGILGLIQQDRADELDADGERLWTQERVESALRTLLSVPNGKGEEHALVKQDPGTDYWLPDGY